MFRLLSIFLLLTLCCSSLVKGDEQQRASAPQDKEQSSSDRTSGINFFKQGNLEAALTSLRAAVKHADHDAVAWYYLGLTHKARGSRDEARKPFERAVNLWLNSYVAAVVEIPSFRKSHEEKNESAEEKQARLGRQKKLAAWMEAAALGYSDFLSLNQTTPQNSETDFLESLRFYAAYHAHESADETATADVELQRIRILNKPEPAYTNEARHRRISGTVKLQVAFMSDRTIKHILVLQSLPHGLTQKALDVARKIKFQPALEKGQPVTKIGIINYSFMVY